MPDWRTTNEVIEAVIEGSECSDDELRYAVRNLSIWQNSTMFSLARAISETPMTAKTLRDLQRAWDNARSGNSVPLNVRLKGGSFEPGVSRDERIQRFAEHTSETAMKLINTLAAGEPKDA